MLAERFGSRVPPLWDAGKLEAMEGRMLAAELEAEGRGPAG